MDHKDIEALLSQLGETFVSQADKDQFKMISDVMIGAGTVERVAPHATLLAIDRLGYQIAMTAIQSFIEDPSVTTEDAMELPEITSEVEKLDEILNTIALGSGIHPTIIQHVTGVCCDSYVNQFVSKTLSNA